MTEECARLCRLEMHFGVVSSLDSGLEAIGSASASEWAAWHCTGLARALWRPRAQIS